MTLREKLRKAAFLVELTGLENGAETLSHIFQNHVSMRAHERFEAFEALRKVTGQGESLSQWLATAPARNVATMLRLALYEVKEPPQ